ncbi:hypothetical protein D3C75_751340 [compost metagenome]
MRFWRNNTIWFDEIPGQLFRQINLKEETISQAALIDIEYLILWHYKQSMSGPLADLPKILTYLELNSSNITNFIGLEKLTELKRLELHYCTKLESDIGLSALGDTLEHLHINHSKKFALSKELLSLKNLRVLCLNCCGDLENLNFLSELPNLIDFRFVDTNVKDGDLTPILKHPSIRSVSFLNKRHFNISESNMKCSLEEKNVNVNYRTIVFKKGNGAYFTYRYNY